MAPGSTPSAKTPMVCQNPAWASSLGTVSLPTMGISPLPRNALQKIVIQSSRRSRRCLAGVNPSITTSILGSRSRRLTVIEVGVTPAGRPSSSTPAPGGSDVTGMRCVVPFSSVAQPATAMTAMARAILRKVRMATAS